MKNILDLILEQLSTMTNEQIVEATDYSNKTELAKLELPEYELYYSENNEVAPKMHYNQVDLNHETEYKPYSPYTYVKNEIVYSGISTIAA